MKNYSISIGGVSVKERTVFVKHLAVMLKSGMSIHEALLVAAEASRGKLRNTLISVGESINAGRSLHEALEQFPKLFRKNIVSAIRAGEESGTLVENLESVSVQLEKERELRSKVLGALLYPAIVLTAAFGLGLVIIYAVLPKMVPIFRGLRVDLPMSTRALLAISDMVEKHGLLLLLLLVFGITFFGWLVSRKFSHPVTHFILLHIPVAGTLTKSANLARFSRTVGMLLKSGLSLDESLSIAGETAENYYYANAIGHAQIRARQGIKLADALGEFRNLFPAIVIQMIRVGEQSGSFESTLFYLADFYEADVDTATKALAATIEPVLLLLLGGAVAFLALSIITPIYEITGNIRR